MSGNRITVTDDHLVVEPLGLDRMWSFTRRLEIPLAQVGSAFFDPSVVDGPKGWRGPGLRLPGKLSGTFHKNGKKLFWNINGYDRIITVMLTPAARFDRLVLTVDDPLRVVDVINQAVGVRWSRG